MADRKNAKETVDYIQSQLVVLDENNENMLVSQFNSNILEEIK